METENRESEANHSESGIPDGIVAALNQISISKDINEFFRELESMANTLPLTMFLLGVELKRSKDVLDERYSAKEVRDRDGHSYMEYRNITDESYRDFKKHEKQYAKALLAIRIVPQSFLVSLISQYDAFIGTIIRTFYYLKPEFLGGVSVSLNGREAQPFLQRPNMIC